MVTGEAPPQKRHWLLRCYSSLNKVQLAHGESQRPRGKEQLRTTILIWQKVACSETKNSVRVEKLKQVEEYDNRK